MNFPRISQLLDFTPRQIYFYLQKNFRSAQIFELEQGFTQFRSNTPCLFVLSTGRVGTQTLSDLFKIAPNIFVHHEPKPNLYRLSSLAYKHSENWQQDRDVWQEAFITARTDLLNYSLYCHRGYVETSPQTTFLAPIILQAIPNVQFIHVVRDPRYVVRSGMRRKWYEGHPGDRTRIVPHPESEAGQKWETYTSFQKNIWLWTETNRWIMGFLSTIPKDQQLTIHSEDIFGAEPEIIEKIFTFIGAPIPTQQKVLGVLKKKAERSKKWEFSRTRSVDCSNGDRTEGDRWSNSQSSGL